MDKLYFILMTHFMLNKGIPFYSSDWLCLFFSKETRHHIENDSAAYFPSPVPDCTVVPGLS